MCDAPSPDSENRICTIGRQPGAEAVATMIVDALNRPPTPPEARMTPAVPVDLESIADLIARYFGHQRPGKDCVALMALLQSVAHSAAEEARREERSRIAGQLMHETESFQSGVTKLTVGPWR